MAVFNSLTFDGENSLDYGIYISGEGVYDAPIRAVEMVTIPGRNGTLAIDQGRFENIDVKYAAGAFGSTQAEYAGRMRAFRNMLASRYSYVRLEDNYHPDEFRLGLYKNGLDVKPVSMSRAGEFDIIFDCKPQRFLKSGEIAVTGDDWSDVQSGSGSLVTIENPDDEIDLKSVTVDLEPIQDLNGYEKPWPAGGGKNKLPNWATSTTQNGLTLTPLADGTVRVNGTATATTVFYQANYADTWASGSYILSGCPSGGSLNTYALRIYKTGGNTLATDTGNGVAFTGQSSLAVAIVVWSGTTLNNAIFKPMIRLASETDATFAPYENICPISGNEEAVVKRVGKNLLPDAGLNSVTTNGITFTKNTDGSVTANGTATAVALYWILGGSSDILKLPNGRYTLNGCPSGGSISTYRLSSYNSIGQGFAHDYGSGVSFDYLAEGGKFAIVVFAGATLNNVTFKPMIRLASDTDDTYEPYNVQTYTTALGRTVYGGTLDVTSGVLTVDRAMVDLGSLSWVYESAVPRFYSSGIASVAKGAPASNKKANIICSAYKTLVLDGSEDSIYGSNGNGGIALSPSVNISVKDTSYTNATAFKTAVTGQTLVYELAEPQIYQLTPQQIELLRTNNIWSDSGDMTVEYGTSPFRNPTEFPARPLIKTVGTGTIRINGVTIAISESPTTIDCEAMEAYNGTESRNGDIVLTPNEFPTLEPGANFVEAGSGITTLEIIPRWWRL